MTNKVEEHPDVITNRESSNWVFKRDVIVVYDLILVLSTTTTPIPCKPLICAFEVKIIDKSIIIDPNPIIWAPK